MLSLTEIRDKTKTNRDLIEQVMDATEQYHPNMKTGEYTRATIYDGLSPADTYEIRETLHSMTLAEFLAKSGTTGIAGAFYMVPDMVYDTLVSYSRLTDACPLIGHITSNWSGGDLLVDIVNDETYIATEFSSGGQLSTGTVETEQATLTPKSFGVAPRITNDLIEDSQFQMVEHHIQRAAMACGDKATSLALTVLITPPDGWGTLNSSATGDADETKLTLGTTSDIVQAVRSLGDDRWISDTLITTPEAWGHSISMQAEPAGWGTFTPTEGYTNRIGQLDVMQLTNPELHASTDAAGATFTDCISLIISRENALLTGRKRWLQINNYADPVKDLAGATITCRQDSVTLFRDAVYKLTET